MAIHIRRREFITLHGSAAAWPRAARAQQAGKLPTIGFLGATPSIESQRVAAFVQRLRELAWIDGRNLAIEYRWAEGRMSATQKSRPSSSDSRLMSLSRWQPRQPSRQSKRQRSSRSCLRRRQTRSGPAWSRVWREPGGNVTGLANQICDTVGKRFELLHEAVPGLRRLAIMANVVNPASVLEMGEAQATARTLGLEVITSEIRRAEDIAPAFEALKDRADALYLCPDPLMNTNRTRINILAVGARLPTMHGVREYVEAGGLMSYGPNLRDQFRRVADYVDKILRRKPADIPVEQPTKFDLVINLTTAKALGLEVPPTLVARADEVIE